MPGSVAKLKRCLWSQCRKPFPPGTGKAKKKEFCSDQCRMAFLDHARKVGLNVLRRREEWKKVRYENSPAGRLEALVGAAKEVLG